MNHLNCSTCILAATSTWDDFRRKVISEYEGFRRAGGQAFVGYRIPHSTIDELGHIEANCPGDYTFIISLEGEETSLLIYEGRREVSATYLPWEATHWIDPVEESFGLRDGVWFSREERSAICLVVEIAVSRLQAFGVEAIDAGFVTADWVLDYD